MSKLLMHIGSHKTGTTSIQKRFTQNMEFLETQGIIYPKVWRNDGHHVLFAIWWPTFLQRINDRTGTTSEDIREIWKNLSKAYADTDKTVIISSENFSRLSPEACDFAELAELTKDFDEVKILFTYRDQVNYMRSLYSQVALNRKNPPLVENMIEAAVETRKSDGVAIDYNLLLDEILKGFDISQVKFFEYTSLVKSPGGIYSLFFDDLGWEALPEGLAELEAEANISFDSLALYAAMQMTDQNKASKRLLEACDEAVKDRFGEKAKTTPLNLDDVAKLKEIFDPANDQLLERFAGQEHAFLQKPKLEIKEGVITREELDGDFWKILGRKLATHVESMADDAPADEAGLPSRRADRKAERKAEREAAKAARQAERRQKRQDLQADGNVQQDA